MNDIYSVPSRLLLFMCDKLADAILAIIDAAHRTTTVTSSQLLRQGPELLLAPPSLASLQPKNEVSPFVVRKILQLANWAFGNKPWLICFLNMCW
eukprot:jgi/Chlat1/7118/Chrsp57S06800